MIHTEGFVTERAVDFITIFVLSDAHCSDILCY